MSFTSNTDELTREYFDSIMITPRYLMNDKQDSLANALPDTSFELWGKTYAMPITTAALSHLHNVCENGMREFALGAGKANTLHMVGMCEEDELDEILSTGADTVKIVKPLVNEDDIFAKIEHAKRGGATAIGMDIDHAFSPDGNYDNVFGLVMRPKTRAQLESYVKACGDIPFIVKGVLSVEDAVKCVEAGAKGIIVSHHHGMMNSMTPPLMVLPEIKDAVKDEMTIFTDCGFRNGMDVYKALASGADAVCVGRTLMDALKGGSEAVAGKLIQMNKELITVMGRTGCRCLKDIDSSVLRFRNF